MRTGVPVSGARASPDYDVVVIGAGPVGAYAACRLAERGFSVGLFEEDAPEATAAVCTGVVGAEAFSRFDLGFDSILGRLRSIIFHSPSGRELHYVHPGVLAYVVERRRFDADLVERARRQGVAVEFGAQAVDIRSDDDGAECAFKDRRCRARVVVIATGVNYRLQGYLGMGTPPGFLIGVQTEAEVEGMNGAIEIYTGRDIAPGSFGWVVPIGGGRARIGILTRPINGSVDSRSFLKRLIDERLGCRVRNQGKVLQKPIAYGPLPHSVAGRVLAVGEAAGQIKTTTGGGIFYGLVGAELAAETIGRSLTDGGRPADLAGYERAWRRRFNPEFTAGYLVRGVAENIDDAVVDRCFDFLKRNPLLVKLIYRKINFEYHSGLLSALLKVFRPVLGWMA